MSQSEMHEGMSYRAMGNVTDYAGLDRVLKALLILQVAEELEETEE